MTELGLNQFSNHQNLLPLSQNQLEVAVSVKRKKKLIKISQLGKERNSKT